MAQWPEVIILEALWDVLHVHRAMEKAIIINGLIFWQPGSLDPFIMQALMQNQVDFLRLFLEQGVIMKDFLTVSRLRRLYNSVRISLSLSGHVCSVYHTTPSIAKQPKAWFILVNATAIWMLTSQIRNE